MAVRLKEIKLKWIAAIADKSFYYATKSATSRFNKSTQLYTTSAD